MTIERYDIIDAGLLPTPAEEQGYESSDRYGESDNYTAPTSPMHRIYRDLLHKQTDLMANHMEDLVVQTQYMHEQVARSSANGNARFKLARHRARVLAWMKANLDFTNEDGDPDELMLEVIDYALTDKAGAANAPF